LSYSHGGNVIVTEPKVLFLVSFVFILTTSQKHISHLLIPQIVQNNYRQRRVSSKFLPAAHMQSGVHGKFLMCTLS